MSKRFINPVKAFTRWAQLSCLSLVVIATAPLSAQDELPGLRHLSASLAEPESRKDTLLTVIAVDRLLQYGATLDNGSFDSLDARFQSERAWLEELAARHQGLRLRSPVFDVASWYLGQELAQHGLKPGLADSPLGPGLAGGTDLLFDRRNPALAASLLASMLPRFELESTIVWDRLLEAVTLDETMAVTVQTLHADWFDAWLAAEPPAPLPDGDPLDDLLDGMDSLETLVRDIVDEGPPDRMRLRRLRFELLNDLPGMEPHAAAQAEYLLLLASAVDGLPDGQYLAFNEILLWIVSDLLWRETGTPAPDPHRLGMAALLAEILPRVSTNWSKQFSMIDPRINNGLATAYEVARSLASGSRDSIQMARLHGSLADTVAQLGLMIPDMAFYFDQPVRQPVSEEINRCIGLSAGRDESGRPLINQEQFNGCLKGMVTMSTQQVVLEELAGDPDGPFGTEQVLRELKLTSDQRINFILGYLQEANAGSCELPPDPQPNLLEWAVVANSVTWMSRQFPVYTKTAENQQILQQFLQNGRNSLQTISGLLDCISGIGGGINDPVIQAMESYAGALDRLAVSLVAAEQTFREEQLLEDADVVLEGSAGQQTAYRPGDLTIGPCDPENICEMSGSLEATRALAGLFPNEYLVAHQSAMGEIEICYENVQWVDRRSQPVREDDPYVANYFGHLSFDLVGRFRESQGSTRVFASNMVSPQEHHYLFGPATDEVLEDSCPVEWVGTRIVTSLGSSNLIRVVPDRLTYLASVRKRPSEVFAAYWSRGDEWRDWFVTGLGVKRLPVERDEVFADRVDRHLQTLYNISQQELYTELLTPKRSNRFQADSLFELLEDIDAEKALLRSQLNLFYPQEVQSVIDVRSAVTGEASLLDTAQIRRYRTAKVPVSEIHSRSVDRLEMLQSAWKGQPETMRRSGSAGVSIAQALLRLDQLHRELFEQPFDPLTPEVELVLPAD